MMQDHFSSLKQRTLLNMDLMKNTYLGPKFENSKIEKDLKQLNAKYDYLITTLRLHLAAGTLTPENLLEINNLLG